MGISAKLLERSSDKFLVDELLQLDSGFRNERITYAAIGGLGVAGYVGFLYRNFDDVDIVIRTNYQDRIISMLCREFGYSFRFAKKGTHLHFEKKGGIDIEIHVVLDALVLVQGDSDKVVSKYSLIGPLSKLKRKTILDIESRRQLSINTIPVEDLLLTKLIAPLSGKNLMDLCLLLASCRDSIDIGYLKQQFDETRITKRLIRTRANDALGKIKELKILANSSQEREVLIPLKELS